MNVPLKLGKIHFIGIGGIGMSGIAEILHHSGYSVQGSDLSANYNTERLQKLGIQTFKGHDSKYITDDVSVVVVSSAVPEKNPEIIEARKKLIPIVKRAEMLAELMRLRWSVVVSGTHGKTTTTSLIGSILDHAGIDPTIVSGGVINTYGTNARLGKSDWMVVESDESDGTFIKLPATIGIVTNIDPEHLEHYSGDFEKVKEAYLTFIQKIPFYGFATLCTDHPVVQSLLAKIHDRRIITYGVNPQADVRAVNMMTSASSTIFDVVFSDRLKCGGSEWKGMSMSLLGLHNVQNALAAIIVAKEIGLSEQQVKDGLDHFEGVKRRFTITGKAKDMTIVDDYGHHPVEIMATIRSARLAAGDNGRVIAVFQPHRFTRVRDLFDEFCTCFNNAEMVIIADIYAASEQPIEGITKEKLAEGIRNVGHKSVQTLDDPANLPKMINEMGRPGDIILCLGAGTITTWAYALPDQLAAL